ncbi:MAG: DUF1501 domain-containing protein [Planctomycetota bacterium]|nr:DUF1501 domain-containing protein [Planctomycetota bacterium]
MQNFLGSSLMQPSLGITRREMIRIGGLSMAGVGLSDLVVRAATDAERAKHGPGFGRAKNCIILYLSGGNPQHDMFDPKPDTPAEIRGEFNTIETTVPGIRFGEHCQLSAKHMHQMALVRSMHHEHNDHGRGSYWMFTGEKYLGSVPDVNSMSRQDMPHMGSCIARIAPGDGPMFPFVLVPHRMDVAGGRRAGQFAGILGGKYDPMLTGGNPNDDDFKLKHLPLAPSIAPDVIRRRLRLIEQLNQQTGSLQENALAQSLHENQTKALDVIGSEAVRQAVDLAGVDKATRARYGRNLFGQSVLLGKRLLDAGTRLVQCNWERVQGRNGFAWDTHWNNFKALKEDLIPPFDLAYHALMTDLEQTGQLDETLVIVAAEFGRSPKVTLKNGGREHWPDVYTICLAGAGIEGGQVYGASDKLGAYPAESPVEPANFVATIYHLLGIDPATELHDQQNRPFTLAKAKPIPLQFG